MWRKLPGCDAVRYVYDKADRLIFVQDGNLKGQGRWRFTIPDALGRTVLSGLCSEPLPVDGSAVEAEFTGSGSYKGYAVKVGGTVRALSGSRLLTVNYYDNYDFLGKNGFPAYAYDSSMESSGYGTKSDARGMLTGSVTGLAGDGAGQLYSVVYYDRRSRPVQRQSSNSLGGKETEYTAYNFTGQPTRLRHVHTAQGKAARTEVRTYSYDHAGRLLTVKHKLDALGEVTLVNNVYDDLGRLQSKSLHGSAVNKQTYTYNIRGWLTGVSGSKFTQNLYYNTGNGVVKYNGSISSMTWKAGNESTVRGYKFTYDGLDRLLNAIYGETAGISTNANRFSENVTNYDKNGNIKGLQRYGQTGASAYGLIDNLTFTLNGNRLNRVDDAVTASTYGGGFEFKDGVKQANEYAYDANGNLTKDLNKGITGISYNCLNLPNAVTFSDGSTITYTYGADGTKLRTVHKIGSATTTTDYCGNVIYENGVQKLLLTEEGYVTLSDSKYHYYLKDHQGNNRVVINQSGTVEETNHYYPFGGVFASAGSIQPYKYNGKEFDNKKGLNWYDYGARHYDAVLGRFITVDALYDKHFKVSPYVYCGNEPVGRIDPDGNDWRVQTHYNRETDKIEYKITVRAALINNSNNKELDIKTLAGQIVEQVNAAYTISGDDFVSTMDMQLRTVNSVDDIKDTEHVLQIVDQDMLTKTDKSVVMAETYKNSLDVKIGTKAVSNMLNNDDNRTFAHELGHSGGLGHTMNVENLMTQKKVIQDFDGDYLKATQLNRSQIQTVRDNYIHNKLNRHIPNWRQKLKRRQ